MSVNMHAILVGLLSVSHTPEQADHAARSVLEQHAHELAEQIRRERDAANIPGSPLGPDAIRGLTYAADLIAPEAQRSATTGDTT